MDERRFGRGVNFLAKYTMPIFLMNTLFAAPLRSLLMKIGITDVPCLEACGLRKFGNETGGVLF